MLSLCNENDVYVFDDRSCQDTLRSQQIWDQISEIDNVSITVRIHTELNSGLRLAAECYCKNSKTINSRYSLVVTHPTTNLPAHGLSTAERTGRPVFHVLWSIAKEILKKQICSSDSEYS
jgi:hypothetical protein